MPLFVPLAFKTSLMQPLCCVCLEFCDENLSGTEPRDSSGWHHLSFRLQMVLHPAFCWKSPLLWLCTRQAQFQNVGNQALSQMQAKPWIGISLCWKQNPKICPHSDTWNVWKSSHSVMFLPLMFSHVPSTQVISNLQYLLFVFRFQNIACKRATLTPTSHHNHAMWFETLAAL